MVGSGENDELYKALVADLAHSIVPTTVMGSTLLAIGIYAFLSSGDAGLIPATIVGGFASAAKIALLVHHRRFNSGGYRSRRATRRLETLHGASTVGMASSVGAIAAIIFSNRDITCHLIATALLFGYCSGVVCRLSVRPMIATAAIVVSSVMSLGSILANNDANHLVVAIVFLIFIIAGTETIAHVYGNAKRHISIRLQMEDLARLDALTRLPNRFALQEVFDRRPSAIEGLVAVHAFDLDGFKAVNDEYGHHTGDALLRLLAGRLRSLTTDRDMVARIGGDEFVLVQTDVHDTREVEETARRVHGLLTLPYHIDGRKLMIGLSLGYSVLPASKADLAAMLVPADQASYQAKRRGGGLQAGLVQPRYT